MADGTTNGKGKVVVITGSSAGVGRAVAQRFAKDGARIGLLARSLEGLEGAKREVEALGGTAICIPTDVADPDAVERAAAAVEEAFGPIDIWINNAMASVFSPFIEMTTEEFRRVTDVTYLGAVHGTRAALNRMLPRDRGMIVQIGSALAYRSIPLQSAYCGAKHALQGFNESLHSELLHAKSNVRLTMVQLPAVNTPQFNWVRSRLPNRAQPVPPIFQPEVIAEGIHFAAHANRRELTIGWPAVQAILGDKFIPGLLDHYLAGDAGFAAQQTDEPAQPRPDNLFEPMPAEYYSAHGRFDARSMDSSPQLWANKHRGALAVAGLALVGFLAGRLTND